MANWCSNTVQFEGDTRQINALHKLFNGLAKKERIENVGQLPDFIEVVRGYFFDIRWEEGALYYETKWAPNTDILIEIAKRFSVGFALDFCELNMQIFGKATYADSNLVIIELEDRDFGLFSYNEEKDEYQFEGETYDSDYEILEILLERKLNK